MKTRYKFLRLEDGKLKSEHGNCTWKIGELKKEKKVDICNSGFHCSKEIYQAFSYVQGEVLAEVEVSGKSVIQEDKESYTEMKIVRAWKWNKEDSVALSIFAAELCLKNFEKLYPDDKRPREAIEAAKKWLAEPTEANQSAARSAAESAWSAARSAESAAWSAESAAESAWSAARSAESAAWSARSAARSAESAARSARSAAWSARSAAESAWSAARSAESAAWSARSAARKQVFEEITKWFNNRLKELETYE